MTSADQLKSSRSQTTNLTSSVGFSRPRLPQTFAADFARAGRLDVEDDPHARIDGARVDRTAGLEQHRLAEVGEPRHERVNLRLQQRLATGDLDQIVAEFQCTARRTLSSSRISPWVNACGVSQ